MTELPSVAIVILNWNGKKYLEQFLPSVTSTSYGNCRIIVADNASTDDSLVFLHEHYPNVEVILNDQNYGFAKGYNVALQSVQADYYMLLNSDVEVEANWIDQMVKLLDDDESIAACQPKILSYANKKMFEYAGGCGGWLDSYGYPFCRGRIFEVVEEDKGQYDDVAKIFWASGAALFVRSVAFDEAGGFDESFFAHQEEIDLCWRLQKMGYCIYVQPASVVYHLGGGTLPMGNRRKVYLNFRNNLMMLAKNYPFAEAIWKIPFRMGLDIIAAYKNLFAGQVAAFSAIARAHWHFYKWLIVRKRSEAMIADKEDIVAGIWPGLLIWEYYIKKKKIFSEVVRNKK